MKREIEKQGRDGESHKISIEPKIDKGFIKVGYMKHHAHHNENFKYEFIDKKDEINKKWELVRFFLLRIEVIELIHYEFFTKLTLDLRP